MSLLLKVVAEVIDPVIASFELGPCDIAASAGCGLSHRVAGDGDSPGGNGCIGHRDGLVGQLSHTGPKAAAGARRRVGATNE
jgi:hypothetical protein